MWKETGNCTINSTESSNSYVLQTEYLKDVTNSKAMSTLALTYDGSTLLTGKFNNSNDLYGIHIDGLTERSVAVRNNSLQTLAKSLGVEKYERIPDRIELEYRKASRIIQEIKQINSCKVILLIYQLLCMFIKQRDAILQEEEILYFLSNFPLNNEIFFYKIVYNI